MIDQFIAQVESDIQRDLAVLTRYLDGLPLPLAGAVAEQILQDSQGENHPDMAALLSRYAAHAAEATPAQRECVQRILTILKVI